MDLRLFLVELRLMLDVTKFVLRFALVSVAHLVEQWLHIHKDVGSNPPWVINFFCDFLDSCHIMEALEVKLGPVIFGINHFGPSCWHQKLATFHCWQYRLRKWCE